MKHRTLASYVRVTYDRVNAIQKVARFSMPGDIDPATVFDFEWRRMPEWDPRRDGVGAEVEVRTVIAGAVRTLTAWRLVPYGPGDQGFRTQPPARTPPRAPGPMPPPCGWSLPSASRLCPSTRRSAATSGSVSHRSAATSSR